MKKITLALVFILGFILNSLAQGFIEHTVKEGETISSIVKEYKVSPYELYDLNPDAKEGISPGIVLVFLRTKRYPFDPTFVAVKKHKVKKKETLLSIAQDYNLDVAVLKKFNPKLYSTEISKGTKIEIPVFDLSLLASTSESGLDEGGIKEEKLLEHIVKTKETKYGIAHLYQMTIPELEELNPHIREGLKVGHILKIKTIQEQEQNENNLEEDYINFSFYKVQPKEGFYRLSKKLGISKDSLLVLNPQLAEGIKLGMVLKYPKKINWPVIR